MVANAWFRSAMVAAISAASVGVPVSSAAASQPTVTLGVVGPVIRSDAPDPSILLVDNTYYAFTTNSGGNNVPVYESTDLVHWRLVGDAMPVLPSWASVGYSWSPSVTLAPRGGYQLFYDAYDDADGEQCIGRATGSSPLGPFVDSSSTPFLCQQALGGSIDASVFQRHGGDVLVWKSDRIVGIWAQASARTMRAFSVSAACCSSRPPRGKAEWSRVRRCSR
jgi:beta-xylosidase